jgi:hypothetical protein
MERLCAIAALPMQERSEVSRAYLARPVLVGRARVLVEMRRHMLSLVRGDGGTVLLAGVAGSGRSRLLDCAVLEGKLLGAAVLRADAGDAAHGDWGVARALCNQLFELLPKEAGAAARLSRDVLGHLIEAALGDEPEPAHPPERGVLLRELRDFILALSRVQRLLLVVDDLDAIDEPSAALLAALAHKTDRQGMLLVLAVDREHEPAASASLRLIHLVAYLVELDQLQADETEALMRSVFGDVANLQLVAGRVHALSEGNPRAAMELAQHLVDRGLARYEAGSWSLPPLLHDHDLPSTLAGSLARRLSLLSAEARELIDALALAEGDALAIEDYAPLTASGERAQVFRALDELVSARILGAAGDRYRFNQQGFVPVLLEQMASTRKRAIHSRLADRLAFQAADPVRRAHHLLMAGREHEAIELLQTLNLLARLPPVPLLERAIEYAERANLPRRAIRELRTALLGKASLVLATDSFNRQFPAELADLERESGLAYFHELEHVPANERLTQAFARAQEAYQNSPEHDRVYPPIEAIRVLARLCGAYSSSSLQQLDLAGLDVLPSLTPFGPLSPALGVVSDIVLAGKLWLQGRSLQAGRMYQRILDRVSQPDRGGLDDAQYQRTFLGVQFMLGLLEGSLGIPRAEQRAEALERDRAYRVSAWRLRMLLHLNQGNVDEARRCQRRAELAHLQESSEQRYLGMGVNFESTAFAVAGDLLGVKSSIDTLTELTRRYARWAPFFHNATARYRWLQGDLEGALESVVNGLQLAKPLDHNAFCVLAGAHVLLLCELERIDEALAHGREYYALCQREELIATGHGVSVGLAYALARSNEHAEAGRVLDAAIAQRRGLGCAGLALGALYEARVRIAIWASDRASVAQFAELCAAEYRTAHNPTLIARFARLLEEAKRRELEPTDTALEIRELMEPDESSSLSFNTIHTRMLECVDESDRARCALTLLLQSTESNTGYLFGIRHGRIELLAALPESAGDERIRKWADQCVHREIAAQVDATVSGESEGPIQFENAPRYTDADGNVFEPFFLTESRARGDRIAALLAVPVPQGARCVPDRELLADLASELITHGDVTGVLADQDIVTRDDD